MYATVLLKTPHETPDYAENYCAATLAVSPCGAPVSGGVSGENGGCIFRVGGEMYFVPTQQVADDDTLYITCDAQKVEGPLDGWRSRLALGDVADRVVEDAIVQHLQAKAQQLAAKHGDAFAITSNGKTLRL